MVGRGWKQAFVWMKGSGDEGLACFYSPQRTLGLALTPAYDFFQKHHLTYLVSGGPLLPCCFDLCGPGAKLSQLATLLSKVQVCQLWRTSAQEASPLRNSRETGTCSRCARI